MNSTTSLHRGKGRRLAITAALTALTFSAVDVATSDAASTPAVAASRTAIHVAAARTVVAPVATPVRPAAAPLAMVDPLSIDVCATTGTATLHDALGVAQSVPVWSYLLGDCSTGAVDSFGAAPVLQVSAGQLVHLTLHNHLPVATSLSITGQQMPTDMVGVAPGQSKVYDFTTTTDGTFSYHPGAVGQYEVQTAMGLYGVLRVGAADPVNVDQTVVISEVDPALNNLADPTTFDMRHFAAQWTLFNGADTPQALTAVPVPQGTAVHVRYLNAGINYHSMSVLGANQQIVAEDGHTLAQPYTVVAQTVGPGMTTDALIDTNGAAPGSTLTVFDGTSMVRNPGRKPGMAPAQPVSANYGGGVGFIEIAGSLAPGLPVVTGLTVDAVTGAVTATAGGAPDVLEAEAYVGNVGTTPVALTGLFPAASLQVTGTVTLPSGPTDHTATVYVRARNATDWGPVSSVTVLLDNEGPATTLLKVAPSPTNRSTTVAFTATGSDAGRGDSFVTGAEYFVGAVGIDGSGTALDLMSSAITSSLSGAIDVSGMPNDGPVTVSAHSMDAAGNWGPMATTTLVIDRHGPAVSNIVVPGSINASTASLKVTARISDVATQGSNVVRGEGFITPATALTVPAAQFGKGIIMTATDNAFDEPTEDVFLDIPASTLSVVKSGAFKLWIVGKDAAGNWGAPSPMTITADRDRPTVSFINGSTTSLNRIARRVNALDASSKIGAVEYFLDGTDPGLGMGKAATLTGGTNASGQTSIWTVTVDTRLLAPGSHSISVRARDAFGNWSVKVNSTINVAQPALFFSTSSNNNPPGVNGTGDAADLYLRNGNSTARRVDMSDAAYLNLTSSGSRGNVDGLAVLARDSNNVPTSFLVSFRYATNVPGVGVVQPADIVRYSGTWSMYFNGSDHALANARNIDAFDVIGTTLYFSLADSNAVSGVAGGGDDADIYSFTPATSKFARFWDATANGVPANGNLDGVSMLNKGQFFVSFTNNNLNVSPDIDPLVRNDVALFDNGAWSLYFDAAANNFDGNNLNVDAIDVP
ncbi:MAG: hypothetical protein RJA49_1153 [Actinomycetota bacterium]